MTTILRAFGPVLERSMEIREEITQELIVYAKEVLPKIANDEERQIEMLRISEKGIRLFQERIQKLYPPESNELKAAKMLVGSMGIYFHSIKQFRKKLDDALNSSSSHHKSSNLANKRPPPAPPSQQKVPSTSAHQRSSNLANKRPPPVPPS
jgi:hypothetical protein